MADSLIFPIGFDLEKGVKDAQGQIDVVLRRLQKTVDGKPLSIRADIDTSKFSVFEAALRGSIQHITDDATRLKTALDTALKTDNSANINRITEAMRNLEAVWKLLPNNQKFDANGKLTAKAQELIRQFNELATASNTYGQTLTQIAGKIRRVAEEEAKANQKRNDGYAKLRKTLGAQENSIANLTAKIKAYQQILNSKEIGSKSFERVAEKIRKLTEKLDAARAKVKALTQTTVDNSKRQVDAHKNVTTALGEQNSYLGKLIKRMVVYSSFSQFRSFMSNIKEVTAQFELQRVSLGAIIQDQNKANQLFSEIKTFALKSPISIMDLTKYTKQVAAYRIENDKLFDTTKRLADVSVGLGVDMGRLVLAFGQVKAASFLRSAEIRQFTEAGIPMLELLAEKFSELQGRAVSTEQVMKMVENRMVDFRMVEQIFTDLTSAGGMFYNMQEKQGNTLFGLWAKLGDAASVMYDEIGNTDEATYVMKGAIQLLTDLMHNWRFVGREALVVGATLMVLHTRMKLVSSNTKMAETATNSYTLAQRRLNAAQAGSMTAKAAEAAKRAAVANRAAAMSTNAWTAAKFRLVAVVNQLKAALLGNWVTLAIAAFAAIGMAIYSAYEKAHRLDNELNKIRSEGSVIQDQSVENFNRLAKAAVESANGSKQQRDALEELNRTYKDILPTDALKLENLRKLKGNYESLTQSVREYIAMQQKEKAINTIQEEYGGDIEKIRKTLHSRFTNKLGPWKMSEEQFSAFWAEFVKQSGDATKTFEQRLHAAFETTGKDAEEMMDKVALHTPTSNPFGENYLEKANRLLDEQRVKIEAESKAWDKAAGGLGKFYDKLEQAKKELSETRFISRGKNGEEVGVDKDTFLYQQMQANAAMKKAAQLIQEDDTLKQAIQDKQVQLQPEWIHLVDSVNPNDLMNITYVNFDAIIKAVGDKYPDLTKRLEAIKKEWGNVVPNDGIVRLCQDRLSQIANGVKGGMDVMRQYLWNGSGTVDDYLKTLNNQITAMEAELFSAEQAVAKCGVVGAAINFLNGRSIGDVKEQLDGLRKMAEFVQTLVKPTETTSNEPTSTKSDNRLQNLQEIERTLTSINKKYEELTKTEGNTAALEYVRKNYDSTLKYINKLGKQFNLNFAMPTDFKDLQSYRKAIKDVIEQLKKKAAIELELETAEGNQAQLQKEIQAKLKDLADRISRTKTAKEFYEKILKVTRNEDMALTATLSVYGKDKLDTFADELEQIKQQFGDVDVSIAVNLDTRQIDYKKLREIWEADKAMPDNLRKIPSAYDSAIKSILDAGDKLSEKQFERWGKDLERAKDYADKRIELAEYTAKQIAEIEAKRDSLDPESKDYAAQVAMYNEMISGYREREKNEAAKLDYEQIKEQIGMFDDLGVRIGTAFESILTQLREYTKSPDFARLGLEAQKNVYQQIAKIEDRIAEGFQGIGIGTVSEYVRQYSMAASEYLTAQNNLREATLKAIEADKEWERVKNGNDEAAKAAALAEKTLADSRVRTAAVSVNAAGANLQRTQEGAARASAKFNTNLQKIDSSLRSLNNGALKALWDLIGDKGKRSVGEFLSGSRKMLKAIERMDEVMSKSGTTFEGMGDTLRANIVDALAEIDPTDLEGIKTAVNDTLVATFMEMGANEELAKKLAEGLSKGVSAALSSVASGEKSLSQAAGEIAAQAASGTQALKEGLADAASKTGEMWGAIISLILSLLDEFAENGIGTFLGDILDNVGEAVEGILSQLLTDSIPRILQSVTNVIKGVGLGLGDLLTGGTFDLTGVRAVKRANEAIEYQQELLDELEYSYGRLEKAIEKAFGADYISVFKRQQQNLEAQAEAYRKMAEAERSKGKKADQEKIKEYENSYRDVMDEIADMQGQIAAQMLGTDLTSAARDFAQAWLDAYKEFGNTADMMSEKFHEMIENMVVESLLARVMEKALKPMFDMIDQAEGADFYSESFWSDVAAKAKAGAAAADFGAQTVMRYLEQAGIQVRDLGSELTGMSRDIAGASEESITGLAAGITTQNHYIAQQLSEVQAIRAILEGGGLRGGTDAGVGVDLLGLSNQAMGHLAAIERHTAETVAECRAIALRCTAIAEDVHKVVVPRGVKGAYGVQTWV